MSKTILLADDSVTIRKVVELTFMEEDFELVSLGGGEEALEKLPQVNPDLVIADVHMPGVTGYEVCRRAKDERPERPVLLLVGTFEPFDAAELEASGADAHLKKPFDSQELLQKVRDLLAAGAGEESGAAAEAAAEAEAGTAAAAVGEGWEEAVPGAEIPGEDAVASSHAAPAGEAAAGAPAEAGVEAASGAVEATAEAAGAGAGNGAAELSEEAVDRIARRVVELLGPEAVRDVAWEVVPDLAEVVIKERLRELESQVE